MQSTGPDVDDAEESRPQPPTSQTEASTSTPQDLDESNQSQSTIELDIIEKATRISASGGACEAGEAERQKLQEFEQEARASKEKSSETFPLNMEAGSDHLDLVKLVEAGLSPRDSDASLTEQVHTINLHQKTTVPQAPSAMTGKQGYEEENVSPLDLGKQVEAPFQETTTTPEQDDNRIALVDTSVAPEDTLQNDHNFGIMPLPRLERTTANRRAQVQPGAYPGGGNLQGTEEYLETTETCIEPATTGPPTIEPENDNSGLAVANLVQDETTPQDLPHAQDYSPDNINNNREERMNQFKTKILLGVIFLLAIIIILVAILIPQSQGDNADLSPTTAPSELPSSNPSQGPSSYAEYWLSLFPESTVSTNLEDSESPQSRAFVWLMEEIDILHKLTEQRVMQRFALATFYFANSNEPWSFSDNWLNHSVHECLWYSGLRDYYVVSEANIYYPLGHISPCEQDPTGYLEDGVLYQGDGILKHFWLPYNGLTGSGIPPELYLLTDLKSLALDELNLTSTIPEDLFGLPNLEYVSMLGCGLFGSIPEAIGRLSKFGSMYFGFNSLTGTIPSSLFTVKNSMRGISLTENLLTGPLPTELGLLTDLQVIWFDGNFFTGTIPTELAQPALLQILDLRAMMLSGTIPAELAVLTDMLVLQLDNSGLSGTIPRWLGNMTSMDTLLLAENSFSGTIPTELGLLTRLWALWLDANSLLGTIPSEIGMYERVETLTLNRNNLSGTIPTELGQLTHVFYQLWLFDNDLTGTVPLELGNVPFPAPWGEVLLHGNDLSGIIPESLCSAYNLTFDCSSQLCGCDSCNCSDIETSPILEGETTNEDGQLLSEANQTDGNQTGP
ncbi:LRR receptor-like serine threonine-protein kinase [Seminavis robusta]|uniref:LRR receptor-like serine threonine-protein kinase n=1 Tax=Seminavis robusta TaxID=568900 RepID=A0A9N8DKR8_9STRA|nr:LRR receptor-like serine threonine-protein kinase [Seminavis robusta]|eukprot:Sro213_g088310.1 LRR receptor-like serine threonine-protein kinase (846) ;mRNA; r:9657-12520